MIHKPGRRLMHGISLGFVQKKVAGGGSRAVSASLNLTSMIDYLVVVVIFLLMSFSASGETPVSANIHLPEAEHTSDMVNAPMVAIDRRDILVNGQRVATTQAIDENNRVQRVDELYTSLKALREDFKAKDPQHRDMPGVVVLQVDKDVTAQVVKSVFMTAAQANFANVSFMVGQLPKEAAPLLITPLPAMRPLRSDRPEA